MEEVRFSAEIWQTFAGGYVIDIANDNTPWTGGRYYARTLRGARRKAKRLMGDLKARHEFEGHHEVVRL